MVSREERAYPLEGFNFLFSHAQLPAQHLRQQRVAQGGEPRLAVESAGLLDALRAMGELSLDANDPPLYRQAPIPSRI